MSINWLPLSHRKNISQVKVIIEENNNQPYSGYYIPGHNTIVAVCREDIEPIEATLAHEYRHHIQRELKNVPIRIVKFNTSISYEKAVKKYYTSSLSELDALIYENKYAKTDFNEWCLKELVDDQGICKRYF